MVPTWSLFCALPFARLGWFAGALMVGSSTLPDPPDKARGLDRRAAVVCPEEIGGPLWACSFSGCGGEDPNEQGKCRNKNPYGGTCQCRSGPSETPSVTVVKTTLADGRAATAEFVLASMTQYKSLKAAVTTADSDPEAGAARTVAAVIAAGGVAWVLAQAVGDAAVAAAIEVPEAPEGHDDDPSCSTKLPPCHSCSGVVAAGIGMCTLPPDQAGCPCRDVQCPDGLVCENDNCNGKDGKCTTDDHEGCECKKDPCPTRNDTPWCNDCGGEDGRIGVCDGIKHENNRYADCACVTNVLKNPPPLLPSYQSDVQKAMSAIDSLPQFVYADWDLDVPPWCHKPNWLEAPQRPNDGPESVQSLIDDWCAKMDGTTVTVQSKGIDTVFNLFRQDQFVKVWLSANNWYSAPAKNNCKDTVAITREDCSRVLRFAMIECDPDSGITHGASGADRCILYNITLDTNNNPNSPPWNPLPSDKVSGKCDIGHPSGMFANFWAGIWPGFCNDLSKQSGTAEFTAKYTPFDFDPKAAGPGRRAMRWRRTPPPTPGMYPPKYGQNWTLTFEVSYREGECRESCHDAFQALNTGPCSRTGGLQDNQAAHGSLDVDCGIYEYWIDPPDLDETVCNGRSDIPFFRADAFRAIDEFCSDDTAKVSHPYRPAGFLQDSYAYHGEVAERYYEYGRYTVWIQAYFMQDNAAFTNVECENPSLDTFAVDSYGDACRNALRKAVDRCYNGQVLQVGSYTLQHGGPHGCVVWEIEGLQTYGRG